jgi:hypothetical protein
MLASPVADSSDFVDPRLVYDPAQHSWLVTGDLTSSAASRIDALANSHSHDQSAAVAVAVDSTVLAVFNITRGDPGIGGLVLPAGGGSPLTRAQAIALMDRITGQQQDLTANVELTARTISSGSKMRAELVIDNHTTRRITLGDTDGCRLEWSIDLVDPSGRGTPEGGLELAQGCAAPIVAAPGTTRLGITIVAANGGCDQYVSSTLPAPPCDIPPGSPLPPGTYVTSISALGSATAPVPAPATVFVVPETH